MQVSCFQTISLLALYVTLTNKKPLLSTNITYPMPFPPRRPGFERRSSHVGFVVEKMALVQVFFEYFDFSDQFSFH
jgi:hypothetical protein